MQYSPISLDICISVLSNNINKDKYYFNVTEDIMFIALRQNVNLSPYVSWDRLQTLEISQSMIPEFKDYAKNSSHCHCIVLLEYYYCS